MAWDPAQYEKFRDERRAPFEDLLALGRFGPGQLIVDLGCGTGELTARLHELAPGGDILGIDSSQSMLAKAQKLERPGLRFVESTIEEFVPPRPVDVLFSSAALHWVSDHRALLRRLGGLLAPGGQLLVQVPSNHDHISYRLVREVASGPKWAELLGGPPRQSPVLTIDAYAEELHSLGLTRLTVFEKVYGHVLADSHAVLEWVRGAMLVPYLERLSFAHAAELLSELAVRFATAMPVKPYYFAFRRTLFAATRPVA